MMEKFPVRSQMSRFKMKNKVSPQVQQKFLKQAAGEVTTQNFSNLGVSDFKKLVQSY